MIFSVTNSRVSRRRVRLRLASLLCALPLVAPEEERPNAESRWPDRAPQPCASTWLYVTADTQAQKVDRVQIGREMVVAEKSGPWLRVYANTDIEEEHTERRSHLRH